MTDKPTYGKSIRFKDPTTGQERRGMIIGQGVEAGGFNKPDALVVSPDDDTGTQITIEPDAVLETLG